MAYPSKVVSVSLPSDFHTVGKALTKQCPNSLVRSVLNSPPLQQAVVHELTKAVIQRSRTTVF